MNNRLKFLLKQYAEKLATESEEAELFELLKRTDNEKIEIAMADLLEVELPMFDAARTERIWGKVFRTEQVVGGGFRSDQDQPNHANGGVLRGMFHWRRVAAAAAIILFVSFGGYLIFKENKRGELASQQGKGKHNDVAAPANARATITLADGSAISLDSAKAGILAKQGNVNLQMTADGKIIYDGTTAEEVYNTLNNPRGSKVIDIMLTDGSRVWLNAGSSLTYPVAFVGAERNVSITGEAYFEVAHNAAKPFKVSKGDLEVQVLGTHFNVNAYDDETDIKVTLLEGSVKVSSGKASGLLKPGEQAILSHNSQFTTHNSPDLDGVMAWKNGQFYFRSSDLKSILRQAARWYDVEIEYKRNITSRFNGDVSRSTNLSDLLNAIELSGGVKFEIDGKKIIVK